MLKPRLFKLILIAFVIFYKSHLPFITEFTFDVFISWIDCSV